MKTKLYISLVCIGLCNIILMTSLLFRGKPTAVVIHCPHDSTEKSLDIKIKTKEFKKEKQEKIEEYSEILPMPPLPPTDIKAKVSVKPQKSSKSFYMWVTATAYCPCSRCCGRGSPGITKTGRSAWTQGIAVDPKYIPQNSRVDIPGYGSWILCDDTGGKIKRNKIDVRFDNHNEAKKWGRRFIKIRVHLR